MNEWNTNLYSNLSSRVPLTLHNKLSSILPWVMAATLFFIPLGSTLKSIALPAALICILFVPSSTRLIPQVLKTLWCKLFLLFWGFILIACLWSPAPLHNQWEIVSKFSKILFLPILVVGFTSRKTRDLTLHGFILAMLITAVCSFYYAYIANVELVDDLAGSIFRNHIMTSFMMALANFISLKYGLESKNKFKAVYFIISLILSWQIFFINEGRTGYIAYLVMSIIFIVYKLPIKKIIYALLFITIVSGLIYHFSSVVQSRVQEGITDIKTLRHGNFETPLGHRYLFHQYANKKFHEAPLIGHGTGSFTYLYAQDKPVASWNRKLLEPHSQYWLIAVEQGVVGECLLILLLAALFWQSRKMKETRLLFYIFLIPFLLGNFTDSLLLYSGTGYLFVVIISMCLAETLPISDRR